MPKKKTSFTLSDEALQLLDIIATKNKRNMSNMIEILIDERAAKDNIKPDPKKEASRPKAKPKKA